MEGPQAVRDRDGDVWVRSVLDPDLYNCASMDSKPLTLEQIKAEYGPVEET